MTVEVGFFFFSLFFFKEQGVKICLWNCLLVSTNNNFALAFCRYKVFGKALRRIQDDSQVSSLSPLNAPQEQDLGQCLCMIVLVVHINCSSLVHLVPVFNVSG